MALKEALHSTEFNHHGTRSLALGWWPLPHMWNYLPPYSHRTTPLAAHIQDPTPQTWPQCSCWFEFTALFTTPRREHRFCQVQPASNVGTPAIPLCTQSEGGSFLRDRIFAKQHAHLPSDKKQWWKKSVTNTPNYLPTPSLETQQQLNQHACPKSTY